MKKDQDWSAGGEELWIRILLTVNKNTAYAFPSNLFGFLLIYHASPGADQVGLDCESEF